MYEFHEAERTSYTIRLPANSILQKRIGYLLNAPGRATAAGSAPVLCQLPLSGAELDQAAPRRGQEPALAKTRVEWHPGELYPRLGFIVTNLARPAERVVAFYNQRGTAELWIKEGKSAIKWTRLSCRSFAANAVRLQLHALAYCLGNAQGVETVVADQPAEKLIKIGAKVVSYGRYVTFQMAEVAVSRQMFAEILLLITRLRAQPAPA